MKHARRHVPGALGFWLVVAAIGVFVTFAIPAVYESSAVIEVREPSRSLAELEAKVRAALSNPKHVREVAVATAGGESLSDKALETVGEAITLVRRTDTAFVVSFRAASAAAARDGADMLAHAAVADLVASDPSTQLNAETDRRGQALAAFVTAHPEVLTEQEQKPAEKTAQSSGGSKDQSITLLRQEKKRLEAELAAIESAAPAPSAGFGPNPYEDPAEQQKAAALRQRIADMRAAIVLSTRSEQKAAQSQVPTVTPTAENQALSNEWRRLVQAVSDAEKAAAAEDLTASKLSARILEPATFPIEAARPKRWLLCAASGIVGLVVGLGWAFWRAARDIERRARHAHTKAALAQMSKDSAARSSSSVPPADPARAAADPPKAVPNRTVAVTGLSEPAPFLATQRGVVDVKTVLAQTGKAPTTLKPQVTVDVMAIGMEKTALAPDGGRPRSDPPNRGAPKSPVPPRPTSDPPRSPLPPRPKMDSSRPSSVPPRPKMDSQRGSPLPPRPRMDSPRTSSSVPPRPDADARQRAQPQVPEASHRDVAFDSTLPSEPTKTRPTISPPPMGADAVHAVRATDRSSSIRPPPPDDHPVDTKRMGSPSIPSRPASVPPGRDSRPRFDTTYRIVDRSARQSSRPPPVVERSRNEWQYSPRATQPLTTPPDMVKPVTQISERPPAVSPPMDPMPRARQSEPPQHTEVFDRAPQPQTALVRVGDQIPNDDLISLRAAPPSWRPPVEVCSTDGANELRQLRDQLLQLRNGRCFVVGVTGKTRVGSAKTIAAARLSTLLAETSRVLLMEANFDWPAVHRSLSLQTPPAAGFSQQMHARIRSGQKHPWIVVRCSERLHVLAESVIRSPGILFSQEFAVAVGELRQCYDFIVADGPVAGSDSDYKPINALTDGIVITVEPGGKLSDALDDATKWFSKKELTAAVFGDSPQRA